jgi:soluble lytic murein transglycosylase
VETVKAAISAAEKDKWTAARQLAGKVSDPAVGKLIRWLDLTRRDGRADFDEIEAFLKENPDWPYRRLLRDKAEAKMPVGTAPDEVLTWFRTHPPVSTEGEIRRISALFAKGREQEGRKAARDAWVRLNFTKQQDRSFYKLYRKFLTREDHHARLERLIWDERYWAARRMLSKVDAGTRALAEARLMLMRRMGGVDGAIAKVPDKLKKDPGLVYERLRWRRRKGLYESAMELLDAEPGDPIRPDKWWIEREYLARWALEQGFISEAYRIASQHGLKPDDDDTWEFSEAEWLSGWIALRFLTDHRVALDHFVAMYQAVSYPVSRARGAYWSGRAAEALNIPHLAKLWYGIAAGLTTTYYGQLAALKLTPGKEITLSASPDPSTEEKAAFEKHELVHVVQILDQAGAVAWENAFISAIARWSDRPGWQALTAQLAQKTGRPDLAIRTAKNATRDGHDLLREGYPLVSLPQPLGEHGPLLEQALALSVIRQESAFWQGAVSPVGARGMMQVMPATAKRLSKNLNLRYSRDRLATDPDYNLQLGQAYLASMIDKFEGSYVLALAAYNAGPARVSRWVEEYGNPRNTAVDVIDWIETIPFRETRNYIQRVMENLQVYRFRLANTEVALALERDLER